MLTETALFAKDFIHPSGIILESAELLASAAVKGLSESERVSIAMAGMSVVSSSYFNIILRRVLEAYGRDALDRVHLSSTSSLLRQIFERSREAARRLSVHEDRN